MRTAFFRQSIKMFQFILPDFGIVSGPFLISLLSFSGTYDGAATYDMTLVSAGAPDFDVID